MYNYFKKLIHQLLYKYYWDYPSKYLIWLAVNNFKGTFRRTACYAHSYAFDSTIKNVEDLAKSYGVTRERARQMLRAFYRDYK